ncbi:hypothetical protein EG68_02442 [Paragonimus skrjabini miyazakii]|uniref:RING-type domain-containing protein n=1 Tax=Paragonimus skrjabini miyazakii TaxID=59628 RepID=A0A8S9Z4I8_9TREM|nr:hypothetical protein EG68_02442 [Paragonimus skrjabini miyazakii]
MLPGSVVNWDVSFNTTEARENEEDPILPNSTEKEWTRRLLIRPGAVPMRINSTTIATLTTTTTRRVVMDDTDAARIVIEVGTPSSQNHNPNGGSNNPPPGSEEALLNRSSVLFVAVSFILLMVISLAWLVFYYVQRFRYLHSKERVSRRLAELAKKAVARIPVKTLHPGDRETNPDLDQCAICIEPYCALDSVRILPCRHYFHKACIDPWLLEQRSCPMCKLDILQAYGLRPDFYPTYPGSDGAIETTAARVVVPVVGSIRSGHGSASGSDDGMERVALIHSHPRGALTAAYVVFTTAATSNMPSGDTSIATVYYMRNSHAELDVPSNLGPECLPSAATDSLPSLAGPIVALSNFPSGMQSENPANLVLWNTVDVCMTTAQPVDDCRTAAHGLFDSKWLSNSNRTQSHGVIATPHSASPESPSQDAGWKVKLREVTTTTQSFTAPVCSVVTKCESMYHPVFAEGAGSSNHANSQHFPLHAFVSVAATSTMNQVDNLNTAGDLETSVTFTNQYEPGAHAFQVASEQVAVLDFSPANIITTTPSNPSPASHERLFSRLTHSLKRTSSAPCKLPTVMVSRSSRFHPFSSWFAPHRHRSKPAGGRAPSDVIHISVQSTNRQSNNIAIGANTTEEAEPSDPLLRRAPRTFPYSKPVLPSHRSRLAASTDTEPVSSERIVFAVVEPAPYRSQSDSTPDPSIHSTLKTSDSTSKVLAGEPLPDVSATYQSFPEGQRGS